MLLILTGLIKISTVCCCCSVTMLCPTLQPHGLQHNRHLSTPSPRVCSNSCPLIQWCYLTISFSIPPPPPPIRPSPPALNLSQHQGLFQWVSSSHQVAQVLELQLQHQSFQWILRVASRLTGLISLQSKGLSRVFPSTTIWKHSSNSLALSLLYGPTLTFIHDY